jgi:hypothetical protein
LDELVQGQLAQEDPIVRSTGEPGNLSLTLVHEMFATLVSDRTNFFDNAYDYYMGNQLMPYAPHESSEQIEDLQQRSITNWMPLLVGLPVQVSYVDGYRRGTYGLGPEPEEATGAEIAAGKDPKRFSPEYACWQRNRMDARQATIYKASLMYGHSFAHVNTIHPSGDVKVEVLGTRHTVAYFDDPVNDIRPKIVLTIKSYARDEDTPGLAIVWDDVNRYELAIDEEKKFTLMGEPIPHGIDGCPVVRYTCGVPDDEGRSLGVINDTMITLQNRVNQASFSTNITADFGAFKVRTAAGLQVLYKVDPNTGEPLLDAGGNPIPEPIQVSQAKMLISDDPTTKFGQLDETPLDGYLRNEDQATKNLAAIAQFPLHALIGNVSNLSAEALNALEAQFMRHMNSLHTSWGESHEELFRLIAEALTDAEGGNAYGGEVRWRDMSSKAFGATMDGLGKAADMLGMPKRALWAMMPGITSGDLADMEKLHEEELTDAIFNQNTPAAGTNRERRPVTGGAPSANKS